MTVTSFETCYLGIILVYRQRFCFEINFFLLIPFAHSKNYLDAAFCNAISGQILPQLSFSPLLSIPFGAIFKFYDRGTFVVEFHGCRCLWCRIPWDQIPSGQLDSRTAPPGCGQADIIKLTSSPAAVPVAAHKPSPDRGARGWVTGSAPSAPAGAAATVLSNWVFVVCWSGFEAHFFGLIVKMSRDI